MQRRRKLILWRFETNMTQREIAKMIGITSSHYSNIERGIVDPSYEVLMKFRDTFIVKDVLDLFEKEEVWLKWQQ